MVDPSDVANCYETMISAKRAYDLKLISKVLYDETCVVMRDVSRKYMRALMEGVPSSDDL